MGTENPTFGWDGMGRRGLHQWKEHEKSVRMHPKNMEFGHELKEIWVAEVCSSKVTRLNMQLLNGEEWEDEPYTDGKIFKKRTRWAQETSKSGKN